MAKVTLMSAALAIMLAASPTLAQYEQPSLTSEANSWALGLIEQGYVVSCHKSYPLAEMQALALAMAGKGIKKSYMVNQRLTDSYRRTVTIGSDLRQQFDIEFQQVDDPVRGYCAAVKRRQ